MEQSENTEMKLQKVICEDKAKEEMIEDMKDSLRYRNCKNPQV